jgi:methyl-accepting chemotaxis protein
MLKWLKATLMPSASAFAPAGRSGMTARVRSLVLGARDGSIRTAINAARLRKEVDQSLDKARQQYAASRELAASAREVTALSANVKAGTDDIAGTADRNLIVARASMDELARLEARMRAIEDKVEGFARTVGQLDHHARSISEFGGIIQRIANQTNLLALNAATRLRGRGGRGAPAVAAGQ